MPKVDSIGDAYIRREAIKWAQAKTRSPQEIADKIVDAVNAGIDETLRATKKNTKIDTIFNILFGKK